MAGHTTPRPTKARLARIGAQALLSVELQITLDGKPASRRPRCDRHCRSLSYHLTSLYEIIILVH